ncbi:hypothetical protein ACTG9Q_00780 [Actinokineospora sp. 24-640]
MDVIGFDEWAAPGEELRLAFPPRQRGIGSRIGGRTLVPHPVPADAPETVTIKADRPEPAEWTARGEFHGADWVEDDAVGWWAEAADPAHDAARAAGAIAAGRDLAGLFVTDRRVAVVLPDKLLAAAKAKKGFLGRTVGGLLESTDWFYGDTLVSLWETDARRLRGYSQAMVGRGFPFTRLARFDFADGSALSVRKYPHDIWR